MEWDLEVATNYKFVPLQEQFKYLNITGNKASYRNHSNTSVKINYSFWEGHSLLCIWIVHLEQHPYETQSLHLKVYNCAVNPRIFRNWQKGKIWSLSNFMENSYYLTMLWKMQLHDCAQGIAE